MYWEGREAGTPLVDWTAALCLYYLGKVTIFHLKHVFFFYLLSELTKIASGVT